MINPQLINSFLTQKSFITKVYFFDELDSTNDFAKKNELQDGSLIITNFQTSGRGRFQRKWESEKDCNLTFSILKNFGLSSEDLVVLVYFTAYSVYSAIDKLISNSGNANKVLSVTIKWPNDILINGRKAAGILVETVRGGKNVVIGVGLNVNQRSFSKKISPAATSIFCETNTLIDLNELLKGIIIEFDRNLVFLNSRKFKEIHSLWKSCNKYLGNNVYYSDTSGNKKVARVEDITIDGRIVLSSGGKKRGFSSSEISIEI